MSKCEDKFIVNRNFLLWLKSLGYVDRAVYYPWKTRETQDIIFLIVPIFTKKDEEKKTHKKSKTYFILVRKKFNKFW